MKEGGALIELKIDPKFKNLIMPLESLESNELEKDIRKNGCIDPIIVWEGKNIIVDGHNRYRICTKFNIPFQIKELPFENEIEVKIYIMEHQLARRNLHVVQKAIICQMLGPLYEEQAKEKQIQGGKDKGIKQSKEVEVEQNSAQAKEIEEVEEPPKREPTTKEILAKLAGTSRDTLRRIEKIQEEAPEKIEDIIANKTSINAVYNDLPSVKKQREINEKKKAEKEEKERKRKEEAEIKQREVEKRKKIEEEERKRKEETELKKREEENKRKAEENKRKEEELRRKEEMRTLSKCPKCKNIFKQLQPCTEEDLKIYEANK